MKKIFLFSLYLFVTSCSGDSDNSDGESSVSLEQIVGDWKIFEENIFDEADVQTNDDTFVRIEEDRGQGVVTFYKFESDGQCFSHLTGYMFDIDENTDNSLTVDVEDQPVELSVAIGGEDRDELTLEYSTVSLIIEKLDDGDISPYCSDI